MSKKLGLTIDEAEIAALLIEGYHELVRPAGMLPRDALALMSPDVRDAAHRAALKVADYIERQLSSMQRVQ